MKTYKTLADLRARRAVVAAQAQRHAEKHDSKATLPTARRYAERLARLDARIATAEASGAVTLTATDKQNLLGALTGPLIPRPEALVAAVRAHASAHYAKGWDVVVEAYDDGEIAAAIVGATSAKDAIRMMARQLRAPADYCADIAAEADAERPDYDTRDREGRDELLAPVTERSATEIGGAVVVATSSRPARQDATEAAAKLLADINGDGGEAAAVAARNALTPAQRRAAIAALNDALRRTLGCSGAVPGRVVMSRAVADLDGPTMIRVMRAVQTFADFTPDNDPYGEHDFAALTVDGERINFKIDYYENSQMEFGAEDPLASYRVLTIMLASDY